MVTASAVLLTTGRPAAVLNATAELVRVVPAPLSTRAMISSADDAAAGNEFGVVQVTTCSAVEQDQAPPDELW